MNLGDTSKEKENNHKDRKSKTFKQTSKTFEQEKLRIRVIKRTFG